MQFQSRACALTSALRLFSLALPAIAVTGCEDSFYQVHHAKSLADAGSYHVAVVAAIPFAAISEQLNPTFKLFTADTAVAAVIPTTTYYEDRLLQAFSAAVGIGLPTRATAGSITTTNANGQYSTNATQTTTQAAGTAPAVPAAPGGLDAGTRTAAILTTAADDKRKVGKDPILEYNLATALYQEVTLLQTYLKYIEQRTDYTPYILRLNVSIQPYVRNQPYDAYVDISFFNSGDDVSRPPLAIPLLVTDNLEGTSTAKSAESIVQIATAITAVVQGAALNASASATRDHLRSILGTDLNSTLTVSRALDNVVKVRLGAPRQPTAGYAMVPRNHTISILVLAKIDKGATTDAGHSLQIMTKTSLRDVENGKLLPYAKEDVFGGAKESLARILPAAAETLADDKYLQPIVRELVKQIQLSDIPAFKRALVWYFGKGADTNWQAIWTVLSETSGATEFQSTSIVLPIVTAKPATPPKAGAKQTPKPAPHKQAEQPKPALGSTTKVVNTKTDTTTTTTTTTITPEATPPAAPAKENEGANGGKK